MAGSEVSEAPASASSDRPGREEARRWIGWRVDEISGAGVGKVEGVYVDDRSGMPEWLLMKTGRFGHHCCVPAREAVAGAGRIWIPWDRDTVRGSPRVEPDAPLTAEEELQLCAHYGIPRGLGRAAELAERPAEATTVRPID